MFWYRLIDISGWKEDENVISRQSTTSTHESQEEINKEARSFHRATICIQEFPASKRLSRIKQQNYSFLHKERTGSEERELAQ